MHEMSIAQSLLDIVAQEMNKHGVSRLVRVTVKHGRLTNIVPDSLHFAWKCLTDDTDHQGAELVTEMIPLKLRCTCGCEFEPGDEAIILHPCPECGEDLAHEVVAGRELYIENLEAT
jgi:hydrogenase nickel incorporation protein HypA/HybF